MLAREMVCRDWLRCGFPRLMCHERKRDHGIWDGLLTTVVNEQRLALLFFPCRYRQLRWIVFPVDVEPETIVQIRQSTTHSQLPSCRAVPAAPLPARCSPRDLFPVLAWSAA